MIALIKMFFWYSNIIAISCLAVISIIYYLKHKNKGSLLLCIGVLITTLGVLLQQLIPFASISLNEAGEIMSSSGPPLFWYTGSVLTSVGLIIIVIGFSLVAFKK